MSTQLENIELLKKTGKKHICIFDYSWKDRRRFHLQNILEKNGFHAWFDNNMDELMKLDVNLYNAHANSKSRMRLRQMQKVLFSLSGKLRPQGIANDTLFLVSNRTPILEALENRLSEIGASDRLYIYDTRKNRIMKYSKPVLNYMEYHVSWHCNLKCKGCSHYCNLYDQPQFGDPVKYRENLLRLHELFDNITTIRLMGGEPFLNPELPAFVQISREVFPDADLRVVSNGLLIPKASDAVLNSLKQYQVTVDISNYPPTAKMLDRITGRLESAGVPYKVSQKIEEFRLLVDNEEKDGTYNFDHCWERTCHFLHDDGRLTMCGIPCFYDAVKDKLRSANEVSEENWIDIYSAGDGYEILRKFNKEIPFCTYCLNKKAVVFPWEGNYTKELTEN